MILLTIIVLLHPPLTLKQIQPVTGLLFEHSGLVTFILPQIDQPRSSVCKGFTLALRKLRRKLPRQWCKGDIRA